MGLRPIVSVCFAVIMMSGVFFPCASAVVPDPEPEDYKVLKEIIVLEFTGEKPHESGPVVPGVKTRIQSPDKVMAFTFNACGREGGEMDSGLLDFLEKEGIPATFFVSGLWLEKNPQLIKRIAANPLFEIANLGLEAKSCLVAPKPAGGNPSTQSVEEVFAEIEKNARKIEAATGTLPRFFRSATAYYDDVAVRIAKALGYDVVGSGFSPKDPAAKDFTGLLLKTASGSIATLSMGGTGVKTSSILRDAIPRIRAKGFKFVKLGDYPLE